MFYRILFLLYLVSTGLTIDYYELLGIQKDAEIRDIRKAFKKLALTYHPDKNKGKEDAHEKFIEINKAYEILKDQDTRKKYDLYGEEGLKENFGNSWKGSYRSWNYYHESFGIYDDDSEIITLSRNDFERTVLDSSDMWFINFYAPHCSHCQILAPSWRKMARELEGVIQIGAVNCEEDVLLCRLQNVYSYPSLMLYTSSQKMKYEGSREAEDLVDYVLQKLPYNVIHLTSANYKEEISSRRIRSLPWLIFSCERSECVSKQDLRKLGIILEHLVYVAEIAGRDSEIVCRVLFCESPITYYSYLTAATTDSEDKVKIEDLEISDIITTVLSLLPELQEISNQQLQDVQKGLLGGYPWLIQFTNEDVSAKKDIQLKRLKSFLPEMSLCLFNCYNNNISCSSLYIFKFPSFLLFRQDGSYEFYYGRHVAQEISRFAQAASKSQVRTLNPQHFPKVTQSEETWFIDFFAPTSADGITSAVDFPYRLERWCPPCMQFLPEYRKASQNHGHLVKFGTVDCSVHRILCNSYNINSYPSAILYKDSIGHKYHGIYSQSELGEFIQDILNPVAVSLSPSSFEDAIFNKNPDDVWVVEFFAPWCEPCHQVSIQLKKMAKMVKTYDVPQVHIGELDCQAHQSFCNSYGISIYPTIRLFPKGSISLRRFLTYNGRSRDASTLKTWVDYMNIKVPLPSDVHFRNVLDDTKPWIIYFFVPYYKLCQTLAPEFEKIAQQIKGIVKAKKLNCGEVPLMCQLASIDSYPTVVFYQGRTGSKLQNPVGEVIHPFSFEAARSFLENKLNLKFKELPVRDEL